VPVLPSWLTEPLWDQFAALLPVRPDYHPDHPLGCHRRRINDRIVFDKMLPLLRFGCSYQAIADTTCSATTIRSRRDEWIRQGVFAELKRIALESYDRIVGLVLDQIAVDGCITKGAWWWRGCWAFSGRPRQAGPKTLRTVTAFHWAVSWPEPTATTPRCSPPTWTVWTTSDPCPTT
jgi:hypothetical protein